ncbi:MAG: hypothetical protein DBY06_04410 [Clostridiales bacterium]|nr:MAG: hypothetical protein DBY06_04410 [Clostridiales bacterium]
MCWRAAHRARRACYDAGKHRGKWVTAREAGGRSQRSGGAAAFGGPGAFGPRACQTKCRGGRPVAARPGISGRFAPAAAPPERWDLCWRKGAMETWNKR